MSGALAARLAHLLETTINPSTGRRWTSREVVNAINDDGQVTISYGYFSSLKVGSRDNPGLPVLRAIARVLDVSEAELVTQDAHSVLPGSVHELGLSDAHVAALEQVARLFARQSRDAANAEPLEPNPRLTSRDAFVASEVESAVAKAINALRSDFSDQRAAAQVAADLEAAVNRFRKFFTASGAAADAAEDGPSNSDEGPWVGSAASGGTAV